MTRTRRGNCRVHESTASTAVPARKRRSRATRDSAYAWIGLVNIGAGDGIPLTHDQTAGSTPLLETYGLTKTFGRLAALKQQSIMANAGEIVGVIGPNGSGKVRSSISLPAFYDPIRGRLFWTGYQSSGSRRREWHGWELSSRSRAHVFLPAFRYLRMCEPQHTSAFHPPCSMQSWARDAYTASKPRHKRRR